MIILFIIIAIIVLGVVIYNKCETEQIEKTIKFSEDKIIKKFNNLLKSLSPRNIETVKKELLDTLEDYKAVKKAQFIDARSLITSTMDSVKAEIDTVGNLVSRKKSAVYDSKGKISDEEGAQLCYDLDLHQTMYNNLKNSRDTLAARLAELDMKIVQFDSSLQFKKSQIVAMIADSIAIKDYSVIDLRLESLENEFKSEVNKAENARIVNEKMEHAEEKGPKFDLEHYKQMYKDLLK